MSQLELAARPLRRDASRLVVPLLILPGLVFALVHAPAATVLCPLMLGPWLWWRRERFWLDRCRVFVDGATLRVVYGARQLAALDLRYATRQFTRAGDLVLSEGDACYLALGVDPPEHAYPDPADSFHNAAERNAATAAPFPVALDAPTSATSRVAPDAPDRAAPLAPSRDVLAVPPTAPSPGAAPAPSNLGEPEGPLGTWRAVRLLRADLVRLCAHLAEVPTRPVPEEADVWSLLQALGSAGVTGRRVEERLRALAYAESTESRPSGLITTLRERALELGPAGEAARRILNVT